MKIRSLYRVFVNSYLKNTHLFCMFHHFSSFFAVCVRTMNVICTFGNFISYMIFYQCRKRTTIIFRSLEVNQNRVHDLPMLVVMCKKFSIKCPLRSNWFHKVYWLFTFLLLSSWSLAKHQMTLILCTDVSRNGNARSLS